MMSSDIDFRRFRRGEGCTEEGCRSKKWYIEAGRKYCQRGHEQTGFTQTQDDEDDWNKQGKTSRKQREVKDRVHTVFSGKEANELYLQCFQLILWKQCFWLVSEKGFPKELETVVRDLWGLRVKVSFAEKEDEEGFSSGTGLVGFSSTSEGENTDTDGAMSRSSRWSRKSGRRSKESLPKLPETAALCYLGILLLRLPTGMGEIFKWIIDDEMIYSRAIKEIPKEMRARLPGHFHGALEIRSPLKGSTLYGAVLEMIEYYNVHFEMVFPPLNSPLMIFKHVKDMALPLEIYPAVRRLATILGVDFTYPILHKRNYGRLAYPEVQLMCIIVVATKLSHPFDNVTRHPENESDPTIVKINWVEWAKIMAEQEDEGLQRGEEFKVTDSEVVGMSEKKMDDYLDWYQRTWIDDRDPKMAGQILDLFPLHELSPRAATNTDPDQNGDRLEKVNSSLIVQTPKSSEEGNETENIRRPGELYKRYRTIEELSETAKAFYEIAAKRIGISLHGLVRGVFETEIRLEHWMLADKKRRLMEEYEDD